jgi:hypothetical protein
MHKAPVVQGTSVSSGPTHQRASLQPQIPCSMTSATNHALSLCRNVWTPTSPTLQATHFFLTSEDLWTPVPHSKLHTYFSPARTCECLINIAGGSYAPACQSAPVDGPPAAGRSADNSAESRSQRGNSPRTACLHAARGPLEQLQLQASA